jgi:integrase
MASTKMERTRHPGIYKRGGRYVVVWRHRGRQHKSFHRTLDEARQAKVRRLAGDSRPASRESFATYARKWLNSYQGRTARGLAERTRATYRRDIEHWVTPYFSGVRLEEVEPPDVRAFIQHLDGAGLRPASIRAILAPVKAMYATAVEDGVVRSNPTRGVRITGRSSDLSREVRALTRDELARLFKRVPTQWRLFFQVLTQTGVRISEAIGLTWADIEFGTEPRLLIRRQDCRGDVGELKSESSRREIPLSRHLSSQLWALGADQPGTARVFSSPHGFALSYGNVRRRVLVPATQSAGLDWVTFHTFRHTCASLLFEAGRDVKQVSAWLGHADPAFTLRTYVHLMDSGIGDGAFMGDLLTDSGLERALR